MTAATVEALDLSDLDLLDDDRQHGACLVCVPETIPPLSIYVALCGRTAVARGLASYEPTPDMCPDCRKLWDKPCPRCGQ